MSILVGWLFSISGLVDFDNYGVTTILMAITVLPWLLLAKFMTRKPIDVIPIPLFLVYSGWFSLFAWKFLLFAAIIFRFGVLEKTGLFDLLLLTQLGAAISCIVSFLVYLLFATRNGVDDLGRCDKQQLNS